MASKKHILITGATGFIGRYLIDLATKEGQYQLFAAVRSESGRQLFERYPEVRLIELDFYSEEQMRRAFESVETPEGEPPFHYVVHIAGITKTLHRKEYMEVNAQHTLRLLNALKANRRSPGRFLLMSSMGSYGDFGEAECLRADMPQRPNCAYGRSKLQAERYVKESGLPYIILCPTGVYGVGEEDYWLSIKTMHKGWNFVSGREPQRLSFVYVKDVARAVLFLLEHPESIGQTYLLSDGIAYTDRDFYRIVSRLLNKRVREVRVPLPMIKVGCVVGELYSRLTRRPFTLNRDKYPILSQRNWHCDTTPLSQLGFSAKYDLESGLTEAFQLQAEADALRQKR